jgi:hypothetical protein
MPGQPERTNADADALWGHISLAIAEHTRRDLPRHEKLWAYYRNPLGLVGAIGDDPASPGGWYRQAQEAGLPRRIRGRAAHALPGTEAGRREVVVENDIAWRVQTMVDFMFGRPVRFESLAADGRTRAAAGRVIEAVWERSGGIAMMQDAALLGHVFGHIDLLLRIDESRLGGSIDDAAEAFTVEPIDPRRGVPVVSPDDYRRLDAYAVHARRPKPHAPRGPVARALDAFAGPDQRRDTETVTEVFAPGQRRVYRDGRRTHTQRTRLLADAVPVVHIQNMSQPFVYAGVGEVEPLVPLQDELNTRLSDRANRVTLQSFRMYLAKGVESFDGASVGPGAVWSTNNPDASVQAFGGDLYNPGEESHIAEIREAMDKLSGVPPLAGGVVRAKLGNLSSANALRVTLMGLIAKTQRKRIAYGRGMERIGSLILRALHESGTLRTADADRTLRTVWPGFVFEDEGEQLAAARQKRDLGVDPDRVLAELGHDRPDPGVV